MLIVGVSAKLKCGKSTLCDHITEMTKLKTKRFSFGRVIKKETAEIFDVGINVFYNDKDRVLTLPENIIVYDEMVTLPNGGVMTARKLLQWWGTDVRRKNDPNYWIKESNIKINEYIQMGFEMILVDDMRFPNEMNLLEDKGGVTVRLREYDGYVVDDESKGHSSETALDNAMFDYVFCPEFGKLKETGQMLLDFLE